MHGDEITYVSLGEGACMEGEFWESLNTACRLHLPVLYVVSDNGYAISVRTEDQSPAPISEMVRGFRGLAITKLDGRDYFQARHFGARAIARVRAGEGPGLIHAKVTRPYSHSAADTQTKYRSPEELADEAQARPDPPARAGARRAAASSRPRTSSGSAARRSRSSPPRPRRRWPRPGPTRPRVLEHVVALPDHRRPRRSAGRGENGAGDVVAFGEAIRRTLHERWRPTNASACSARTSPTRRRTCSTEVEGKGGVFGTTLGLQRTFGVARCFNTPLAEANIVGRAVGQAVRGLRPCPEIQFFDYIWPAMTQIKSEAATIRWRSNGAWSCPMVLRVPIGGYLTGGSIWHSQCGESIFAHVPGLIIAFPSRARDAAGMLRAAFRARTRCCSSSTSTCCASRTRVIRSRRRGGSCRSAGATCGGPATTSRS